MTSEHDAGFFDFGVMGHLVHPFHKVDSNNFIRGSLISWDPNVFQKKKIKLEGCDGHEIGALCLVASSFEISVISAYKSPSMDKERSAKFFRALVDAIGQVPGPLLVIGDLNSVRGRKLAHASDEGTYITDIIDCGLKSLVTGPTHDKNQLDYAFSNVSGLDGEIVDGFGKSDHKGILLSLDASFKTYMSEPQIVIANKAVDTDGVNAAFELGVERG